jgi:fumarate reductase flavoprotein subunit
MKRDFDVIVVGGGGAGLSAAISAAGTGATVLVVEADRKLGGTSALSTGVVYAASTSVQRKAGITDTPEEMFTYAMTLNAHKAQPHLLREMAYKSADALDWLISLGVEFDPADLYISGVDSLPRGHKAKGNGTEIMDALDQTAHIAGVTVALETRVRELDRDEDGSIGGIVVGGQTVTAGAVVLTTGGFGANSEMLARYYPQAAISESLWYVGSPHARGDGLAMGMSVGAEIGGHNNGVLQITPGLVRELESYLPGWLIFVNRDGRRFIRETDAYGVMSGVMLDQIGGEAFAIFDEAARRDANVIVTYKPLAPSWTADQLQTFINGGRIAKADSLDALAELVGVRAATFATTVENYNHDCELGADTMFFKNPIYLRAISTPPYYACRLRAGIVGYTAAGLRIDTTARALDEADRPIAGLYAAGETTCVLPGRYIGGGASLTNNFVFGRIAGNSAARHAIMSF